jgi:hypothetical protein
MYFIQRAFLLSYSVNTEINRLAGNINGKGEIMTSIEGVKLSIDKGIRAQENVI